MTGQGTPPSQRHPPRREAEIAEIAATLRRRPVKDVRRIAEMVRVLVK